MTRLSFGRTVLQYKIRNFFLDVMIVALAAGVVAVALLCASMGEDVYSESSFIEVSLDGTSYYIPDSRKVLGSDWIPSLTIQERFLKTFIQSLRSVSTVPEENYDNLGKALYRSAGQAFNTVSAYINANPTSKRSTKEIVSVPYEDIHLTRYDEYIWKIVWREISCDPYTNDVLSDKQYEAVLYTTYSTSETEEQRTWNPLGMYVIYMDSDLLRSYM